MASTYGADLASALTDREAQKIVGGSKSSLREKQEPIPGELIGSDTCVTSYATTRGPTPVLRMCGELLAAGIDPDTALHVYRQGVLALRVRSIREGATLEPSNKGIGFVRHRVVRRASPMRSRDKAARGVGARVAQ